MACRANVMQQRAKRLSLLHWQHANLCKVFQRWKEYKGRRAQLFGSLLALACKWEAPLLQDAWAAWRDYTAESRRIKVRPLLSSSCQSINQVGDETAKACGRIVTIEHIACPM